jgi:hypothetical protein
LVSQRRNEAPWFQEVAEGAGLRFRHFIGATGEFYFPENMGAGVALLDYDGDGDLDVYFAQGSLLDPSRSLQDSRFSPPSEHWPGSRLFRNDLVPARKLVFSDVTERSGLSHKVYGMGAAVGDYDNDGDPDLYATNFGSNILYRNNGDGTFADVTQEAGVDDPRWSTSAAFVDYDRDGDLDLFVCAYVDFTVKGNRRCPDASGEPDYCNPAVYQPLPDRLFRNEGSGRFKDISVPAGITAAFGRGLGVACADFNGDDWPDILVANDGSANQLWINQKDGTFSDQALLAGVAYNANGQAEAGMGVAVGDFENDGDEDIFITHLSQETHTLYLNKGTGRFHDSTIAAGLTQSRRGTGFGTGWFDYDSDGQLDLFVANGAVYRIAALRGEAYPYHQRNQLFWNDGSQRLVDVTVKAGMALALSEVSRGAAFGDIDNDGDIDVLVSNNNGPGRLILNQVAHQNHWLMIRLQGVKSNRDAIGARVGILRQGHAPLWRRAHRDGSYLSASDIRVHFGLGSSTSALEVVVIWPSGLAERWKDIQPDSVVSLHEGSGISWTRGSL